MLPDIVCFVLCGGMGRRLEPLSTPSVPKQFLNLFGEETMLDATLSRLGARMPAPPPIHLVASACDEEMLDRLVDGEGLNGGGLLLEPVRRDTAMALAVATAHALDRHGDVLVLATPSDHQVETHDLFWRAIERGMRAARDGRLVLFGARPTRPEVAYGYIEAVASGEDAGPLVVRRFHEKPDRATARRYIGAGNHYWNCGLFLFRAAAMRERFEALRPDIWQAAEAALAAAKRTADRLRLCEAAYGRAPTIAFDRAIVERANDAVMVPAEFRWRDMGTWRSLVESALGRW